MSVNFTSQIEALANLARKQNEEMERQEIKGELKNRNNEMLTLLIQIKSNL